MKSLVKKFLDVNFFFANILVPLAALVLYCVSFGYFSTVFLVKGVNYYFVSKLVKYLLIPGGGAVVIFFILLKTRTDKALSFKNADKSIYAGDIFLLLLPLTPVTQYVLTNQTLWPVRDILTPLFLFAVISAIYILVIPGFLSRLRPARTLMISGLAFVFTVVSMSSLSSYFKWFEKGALLKQLIVLGGAFVVVWFFYILDQRKVLYILVIANFLVNSSIQFWKQSTNDVTSAPIAENKLLTLAASQSSAPIFICLYTMLMFPMRRCWPTVSITARRRNI